MSVILKTLQKIDPSYQNYRLIIEHALPVVFTIDKGDDTFIGFVNVYRPRRGQIAVTLSKTTDSAVQNLIQTNGRLCPLFATGTHYHYDKGIVTETPLDDTTYDIYAPHKAVRFNDFPNTIIF